MGKPIALIATVLLLAGALAAQQDQGVITGTVTDSTGAVIPGAKVTVRNVDTNIVQTAETNVNGVYFVGPVRVGRYEVAVEAEGFKKSVRSGIEVHANDRIGLDFELEIGAVTEVIEVTGQTPILKTETSALETVVDRRQIEQLPLVDRNYQILAKLAAGVFPEIGGRDRGPLQRGGAQAAGFTAHGQPALQNNYLIDGIDNNSTVMGMQDRKAQTVIPSLDAVQEFKVQTSNYSAEFGRNAGAVVNVTIKSGTNELHGSLYEFVRNDIFDARDAFSYTDRTGDGKADPEVLRQNMFGGTIGGPIVKNKAFYFFSYEGWRVRLAQNDRSVIPTPLERRGDFSQTRGLKVLKDPLGGTFPGKVIPPSRLDPVMSALMELYPEPNFSDITRTNYLSNPPWRTDRNQYDMRFDYHISSKDTIFGRYSWYDFNALRGAPLPGLARGGVGNDRSLDDNRGRHMVVNYTRVVSPSIVNEFRFGYKWLDVLKRNDSDVPLTEANSKYGIKGVPQPERGEIFGLTRILFTGRLGHRGLGGAFFQPNQKDTRTLMFVDTMTWLKGNHSIKIGADIRIDDTNINGSQWARGELRFNGRYTGIGIGDGLVGWVDRARLSNLVFGQMRFNSYMFFVQDDWKVTPNLTLNLGLRYELTTPYWEKNGRAQITDIDPSSPTFGQIRYANPNGGIEERALQKLDTNNWAPRIGFAYRIGDRWTVRAGAGIFYGGAMALGASARTMRNFPFTSTISKRGKKTKPAFIAADGFPPDFLGDPNFRPTHVSELPPNSTHRTWDDNLPWPQVHQWNLSIQRQLSDTLGLTVAYVGSGTQNIHYAYNANAAGIGDPETEKERRRLFPHLDSVTFRTPLAHSTYHGLDLSLEKRYSQGYAFTFAYTWGHNIGQRPDQFVGGDNAQPQDFDCFRCEKGNSSSDVRHRVAASYIIDLPFGRGRRWLNRGGVVNAILGGWQLSGWISAQTGMYFSVLLANPTEFLGTSTGIWRPDVVGKWRLSNPTPDGWFNPGAFRKPCTQGVIDGTEEPDGTNCWFGNLGRNTLQEPGLFNWTAGLDKRFDITERFRLHFRWEVLNILNHPSYGTPNRNLDSPDVGIIRSTLSQPRQMQLGLRLTF